ncbi:MAG: acetate--CoA ligase family protein [Candidatus Helarchaeota archaeon]
MAELDIFFNPSSVAIIGATETPGFGYFTVTYLLASQFKVYPVHIKKREVFGHKAYKNIKEIPDPVELAIIIVPTPHVLKAVQDSIEKGVKGIIIESAGFAETGREDYREIQQQIADLARQSGVRIIGPNCLGVTNVDNKFTTAETDFSNVRSGNIAIVAQSGVLGNIILDWAFYEGIGFSKVVTLGNKLDVDECDMLEYLKEDSSTEVICLYLESIRDRTRFLQIAKEMTKIKPILVVKSGRTQFGARAALSHTGSMAGKDNLYDAIFRQAGVIRVEDFQQLFDYAKGFAMMPPPKGDRIAIITSSGSLGILTCDEIERNQLQLAPLQRNTIESMKRIGPDWVSLRNPVDIGPAQLQMIDTCIKAVLQDGNVDALIWIEIIPERVARSIGLPLRTAAKLIDQYGKQAGKPVIVSTFGSPWMLELLHKTLDKYHIPITTSISNSVGMLAKMLQYSRFKKRNAFM